jgi:Tfp pilus assembly major pilin PilA
MIVVSIIGIVTAIAIPAFSRWMRKARASEAAGHLNKMWQGSVGYYESGHAGTVSRRFPASDGAVGVTDCCTAADSRCPGSDPRFNGPTWIALQFVLPDPYFYYASYESFGANATATFAAGATGDLDCDDVRSTYVRQGAIGGDGDVSGATNPTVVNPLE